MVSDIAMPDDGLELIRVVKTISETRGRHIPTIAITAYRDRREELLKQTEARGVLGMSRGDYPKPSYHKPSR